MLELSLKDCHLDNSNIFVKRYEQECFQTLFPQASPTDKNLSVFLYESSDLQFGTIDLVRWITAKYPSVHFSMIIGEDAFNDICEDKWKEVQMHLIS